MQSPYQSRRCNHSKWRLKQNCFGFVRQHNDGNHGTQHHHRMGYTLWGSMESHICMTTDKKIYLQISNNENLTWITDRKQRVWSACIPLQRVCLDGRKTILQKSDFPTFCVLVCEGWKQTPKNGEQSSQRW